VGAALLDTGHVLGHRVVTELAARYHVQDVLARHDANSGVKGTQSSAIHATILETSLEIIAS
jgi:hypothetical protein